MFLFVELEDNDEEETESETTIFVKNLNFDTTEDSLKKVEIVFLVSQEMMEALISLLTHLLWYFVPASFSNIDSIPLTHIEIDECCPIYMYWN